MQSHNVAKMAKWVNINWTQTFDPHCISNRRSVKQVMQNIEISLSFQMLSFGPWTVLCIHFVKNEICTFGWLLLRRPGTPDEFQRVWMGKPNPSKKLDSWSHCPIYILNKCLSSISILHSIFCHLRVITLFHDLSQSKSKQTRFWLSLTTVNITTIIITTVNITTVILLKGNGNKNFYCLIWKRL